MVMPPSLVAVALALGALLPTSAFVPIRKVPKRLTVHRLAEDGQSPQNALDLFASENWAPIKAALDRLPVFTCASAEGKPLAYTIETKDDAFQVPFFYTDVDEAKAELGKAKENTGLDGLDIIPFPLGEAFQMWATDRAVLVPAKKAVQQAGAPPGTNAIGQHVPLFACMDIMQETEDGRGSLPLFMVLEEANAAMDQALAMDGGNKDDFEVVSLSLQRAVEILATSSESPAFDFIPPQSSLNHIQDYLSE